MRLTLRTSPQTQRTYRSTYGRFALGLTEREGRAPSAAAFTAEAIADYLDQRERECAAATVKERAALNKLARYLHTLGATTPPRSSWSPARAGTPRKRPRAAPWARRRGSE